MSESLVNLDNAVLAGQLRSHFGSKWHCETTICFDPNGKITVIGNTNQVELTRDQALDLIQLKN